jgi:hypothetical protein
MILRQARYESARATPRVEGLNLRLPAAFTLPTERRPSTWNR